MHAAWRHGALPADALRPVPALRRGAGLELCTHPAGLSPQTSFPSRCPGRSRLQHSLPVSHSEPFLRHGSFSQRRMLPARSPARVGRTRGGSDRCPSWAGRARSRRSQTASAPARRHRIAVVPAGVGSRVATLPKEPTRREDEPRVAAETIGVMVARTRGSYRPACVVDELLGCLSPTGVVLASGRVRDAGVLEAVHAAQLHGLERRRELPRSRSIGRRAPSSRCSGPRLSPPLVER